MKDYLSERSRLATLFFLHGMALSMWFVPLSTVLGAHGLGGLRPYAFATMGIAAFVSPLIFGAMADRHAGPVMVLRWLALATAGALVLATVAIGQNWPGWAVLGLIQLHSLCAAPTWSISSTVVLSRLRNSKREFGPVRALGTLGWAAGCWLVSALNADTSAWAGAYAAVAWLVLAGFTYRLPNVMPPRTSHRISLRERLGLDALVLLKQPNHRVVFLTLALFNIPLAAFYAYTPQQMQSLGLTHTSAWMSLGQITEIIAMFCLAGLLASGRLKWVFTAGLVFGLVRYALCAVDRTGWVLASVSLHGFAFTLFFITAQIYLDERVETAWRARAQALMSLMMSGFGNLFGYLATGWWFAASTSAQGPRWSLFWGVLAATVALVLVYFARCYREPATSGEVRQ